MITDFHCKNTEQFFNGKRISRFTPFERVALRKLQQLNAAEDISFLRIPPSNHLEKLIGDRQGQYSIRINEQWRICFVWQDGQASQVEIVDYH
ncbi:MAG: type II toxin-antitoxin system RelE/ParE family toxin [Cardiobacteriaceae bacterium]|nr:type II toxin-antitoxin system RelE/ParE family toxin [Cardiobacteriaceae bacterium]